MVTALAVYTAVNPASVSIPVDSKDPVSPGKTCATRADIGIEGEFNVAVLVLVIMSPFGSATEMPLVAGRIFKGTAASRSAMKLPVVPVSALIEWVETKEIGLFDKL
jgi:hypothetical protein